MLSSFLLDCSSIPRSLKDVDAKLYVYAEFNTSYQDISGVMFVAFSSDLNQIRKQRLVINAETVADIALTSYAISEVHGALFVKSTWTPNETTKSYDVSNLRTAREKYEFVANILNLL